MEPKSFRATIELKADPSQVGQFVATFATLNVIDKDGDVTVPGAFQEGQPVRISAWGHNWGALPVGNGTIHADQEKAWVEGQFFLDTVAGKDTYLTVKSLGDLQEWSYGFEVLKQSFGKFADRDVRFLEGLNTFEVSPVMIGAGVNTGTDTIKGAKVGARNAAADLKMIQGIHDATGELGASCGAKSAHRSERKDMGGDDELILPGSYEALAESIKQAAGVLLGESDTRDVDIVGTFGDHAVIKVATKAPDGYGGWMEVGEPTYYEIPYTADTAGVIQLGVPTEVGIEAAVVAKSAAASHKGGAEDQTRGNAQDPATGKVGNPGDGKAKGPSPLAIRIAAELLELPV